MKMETLDQITFENFASTAAFVIRIRAKFYTSLGKQKKSLHMFLNERLLICL
jgi:hypothetical protein